jgi:toxin FitB
VARTLYLIDTNVFREMGSGGNSQVRAWLATIDDDQQRVSPVVYQEMREGRERERRKLAAKARDTSKVDAQLAALDQFEKDYADREVPITMGVKRELTKLLGAKGNNERDMTLAATARVHDLVIVTRNVADFEGRGVRVLNPFETKPAIRTV